MASCVGGFSGSNADAAADAACLRHQRARTTAATAMNSVLLVLLLIRIVLGPLEADAGSMAHRDPTEIIATPFPVEHLTAFVGSSVVITLLVFSYTASVAMRVENDFQPQPMSQQSVIRLMFQSIVGIAAGGVVVFFASILCGASPFENVGHTLLASTYLSTLAFGPILISDGARPKTSRTVSSMVDTWTWAALFLPLEEEEEEEVTGEEGEDAVGDDAIRRYAAAGTFAGVAPFMILRILDAGLQIQRWPVPMLLGGTVGCSAGALVGAVSCCCWDPRRRLSREEKEASSVKKS